MATPHCLLCGACCFSQLDTYVRVTGADHTRLANDAERLSHFIGNRCYMRMTDGHCSALAISDDGQFVCTVYAERPDVCRALARDSIECQGERALKAERPLIARLRRSAGGERPA
jgi:Fe-S-cluster containining protein